MHAKLITAIPVRQPETPPPPILHPLLILLVTSVATQLLFVAPWANLAPNKSLHKKNHPPPTVQRWCKQIQLLRSDRRTSWIQSGFNVRCVYSNTSLLSRSFSPLLVIAGLATCARLQHVDSLAITIEPSLPRQFGPVGWQRLRTLHCSCNMTIKLRQGVSPLEDNMRTSEQLKIRKGEQHSHHN